MLLLNISDLFSWTIISSGSKKYKVRTKLEVPKKTLFKPTPSEQNNFTILALIKMVSHGSHTNHEFLILVIQVTSVSSAIESFVTF